VLSGGEPAALAIVDATVRLLPGAMSDLESARTDSFFDRGISAPSYTRPAEYRGHAVPEVLVGGDHAKVAAWRDTESLRRTREAEARDRHDWQEREARIADRESVIAEAERIAAEKAAKKARQQAAKARARARAAAQLGDTP
jgi:tRNA (guanine37-N1)-methyltransferase